jgi:hypothetical protein
MRVYIGPFKSWWGPYQIAGLLKYIGVPEESRHKIGEYLADTKLDDLCQWIDSKRKRNVKVKIDRYDAWNADGTMAIIILPLLKEFRRQGGGAPQSMEGFKYDSSMTGQEVFEFYKEDDQLSNDIAFKQWDEILDEMIWTFEQLHPDNDWESQYSAAAKFDSPGWKKHHERIDAGLTLFGKYFRGLWN